MAAGSINPREAEMKPPPVTRPQAVILIGLQASGKSTFARQRFFDTHVRLNLDMLRTRHRLGQFLDVCIATRQSFVIDNTNVSASERATYIQVAREAGFEVVGFYFRSTIAECLERNSKRSGNARVPDVGLKATAGRLDRPNKSEGFDTLFYVRIDTEQFVCEEWNDDL
jgi:predicted kinase